jgi:hypothetical protein
MMTKDQLSKEIKAILRTRKFKGSRLERILTTPQFILRAKIGRQTMGSSIYIDYYFVWTGEPLPEIDPGARTHLMAGFGDPSGNHMEVIKLFSANNGMPDDQRFQRLAEILDEDLRQWEKIGASAETFRITFRSALTIPARPYIASYAAWLPGRSNSNE